MPDLPRWRRRKDARPSEIAHAALDVFVERGFAAARLDDIAARAGISKGALYLYFASKEELLKAAITDLFSLNLDPIEHAIDRHQGTMADLIRNAPIAELIEFLNSPIGRLPKLMIAESANFPDVIQHLFKAGISRALSLHRKILTRGIEAGEFRPVNIEATAEMIQSQLLFLAVWTHTIAPVADHKIDPAQYLRNFIDILLTSLSRPIGPQSEDHP
jgi:AcrR family transcriptional regulator